MLVCVCLQLSVRDCLGSQHLKGISMQCQSTCFMQGSIWVVCGECSVFSEFYLHFHLKSLVVHHSDDDFWFVELGFLRL